MAPRRIAVRLTDLPVRVGTDYPASDIDMMVREDAAGWRYHTMDGRPLK